MARKSDRAQAREDPPSKPVNDWLPLLGILALALLLRVWDLASLPNGFFCDEAANGCDAYSILRTGRSLFGKPLPLFFSHHGIDYVESMYTYLTVPFVAWFGLNELATRLPAALAGAAGVWTAFLLARRLYGRSAGFVAALLVAVSPWHLMLSRIAIRGILLPLFVTLAIYLFLKALRDRRSWVPCGLAFGLSLHTYAVAKALVPILAVLLVLCRRRELIAILRSNRRAAVHVVVAAAIFLLLAIPVYHFALLGPGNMRFKQISVFSTPRPVMQFVINLGRQLNPVFLFAAGDENLRHSLPGFGQILLVLTPFVLIGAVKAVRERRFEGLLPLAALVIGHVPAALTTEGVPHALRAIGAVPFAEMLAASGIVGSVLFLRRYGRRAGHIAAGLAALAVLVNAAAFLRAYFVDYRVQSQYAFQYGMRPAIEFARQHAPSYDTVAVTDRILCGYIFPLFFEEMDPSEFQERRTLGRYRIVGEHAMYGGEPPSGRVLYILRPSESIPDTMEKQVIRGVDGRPLLKLAASRLMSNSSGAGPNGSPFR